MASAEKLTKIKQHLEDTAILGVKAVTKMGMCPIVVGINSMPGHETSMEDFLTAARMTFLRHRELVSKLN